MDYSSVNALRANEVEVMRQILHVDMDAYYASVEQHDRPELRGKPVIVGGPSKRGIVCAASYEARPFGVRSAMPMVEAMRKCPEGIVVAPRHARYAEVSRSIFGIFRRYTPLVEGLSLDEAFLDVTGSQRLFGRGEEIARQIKDAIRAETGLTASAGVAHCKFVAKIASDLRKPDGLVVVPDDVAAFLAPLPVERMWGIGPKTAKRVRDAGYSTIGDLARADAQHLEYLLGSWGAYINQLARGQDDRDVIADGDAKSIGAEETFEQDLTDRASMEHYLLAQSARVASRLVREELVARCVSVKIKYSDFTAVSRQLTLREAVCDTDSIFHAARELLSRIPIAGKRVRLTGVSMSDFAQASAPQSLFPDERIVRGRAIETATQALRDRFGKQGVTRAALLEPEDETIANLHPHTRAPRT
ncbi:MAG: DNA polymerase IV [Sandaracinaceae bacterium]|nr:DNA polymerase IV [Sandaracinaceae bacterium]